MPGKSRHSKGKRYQYIKKNKNIPRQNTVAAPTAAAAVAPKPAVTVQTAPAGKAADSSASAKTNQYAYVTGDLKRIGILTGIIIVILIVLYFALT
jgi:hypothetical protein